MLLLAYCAGVSLPVSILVTSISRAIRLTIRQTKFFKTRILPLPDSVMIELRAFINARRRADASQDPRSGLFWHAQGRTRRYTPEMITWLFDNVIGRAGLKPLQGRIGPRPHDLRHSMVVNRILEWYRAASISRVVYRSSRLTSVTGISTPLWSITVTQDLLHLANERFRAVGAPCLNLEREVRS
ncbi:hypothetical protein [Mesorhizobium sp. M0895]|uniref:hypothetical protein n=1 Tax=Mesorhizobium sp. M0895 TaxID=2957019 RepID=UPI00333CB413